jgi:hypothetical protein
MSAAGSRGVPMTFQVGFGLFANICSVAAAIFSAWVWIVVVLSKRKKRQLLEEYLAKERPKRRDEGDQGARGIVHLMDELHLSESDLLEAAFDSDQIVTLRSTKEDGIAKYLLLKHKDT